MSKRALIAGGHEYLLHNVVWESGDGGVVLLVPSEYSVWKGFVMAEEATRADAKQGVELFAELYFKGVLGLRESWDASAALCLNKNRS